MHIILLYNTPSPLFFITWKFYVEEPEFYRISCRKSFRISYILDLADYIPVTW